MDIVYVTPDDFSSQFLDIVGVHGARIVVQQGENREGPLFFEGDQDVWNRLGMRALSTSNGWTGSTVITNRLQHLPNFDDSGRLTLPVGRALKELGSAPVGFNLPEITVTVPNGQRPVMRIVACHDVSITGSFPIELAFGMKNSRIECDGVMAAPRNKLVAYSGCSVALDNVIGAWEGHMASSSRLALRGREARNGRPHNASVRLFCRKDEFERFTLVDIDSALLVTGVWGDGTRVQAKLPHVGAEAPELGMREGLAIDLSKLDDDFGLEGFM